MRVTALVLLSVFGLVANAEAQVAGNLLEDPAIADEKNITGYFHFKSFLDLAFAAFREGPEAFYFTVLRKMGIALESQSAKAIEDAAMEAHLIDREVLDLKPYAHDSEVFYRMQADFQRRQVRQMASVYHTMMPGLAASGMDYSTFWEFIQKEIAHGTGVFSTEPGSRADRELFAIIEQEFTVTPKKPMTPQE
ncbi:MAG TPA: hypothetical protein VGG06_23410 [Thermoanaerobaculia bacterium]|jgi:hypothetical protein